MLGDWHASRRAPFDITRVGATQVVRLVEWLRVFERDCEARELSREQWPEAALAFLGRNVKQKLEARDIWREKGGPIGWQDFKHELSGKSLYIPPFWNSLTAKRVLHQRRAGVSPPLLRFRVGSRPL